MWTLSHLLTKVFDVLLLPFSSLPPFVGLAWISLLTGIGMLMVYRYISNQDQIKRTKDLIKAHFLEIRFFKDDMMVTLIAQKDILVNNFKYMGLALKPMVFMLPPVILILVQLEVRYGVRPFRPGDVAVVSARLTSSPMDQPDISLTASDGIEVQTPAVRIADSDLNEVSWRIGITQPGRHDLQIQVGDETYQKAIYALDKTAAMAKEIRKKSILESIFQPVERPLASSGPIQSISVQYPSAEIFFFHWNVNWLVGFFILSIIFGFAMKGTFKVEI